jgi:hypothetical protein
MIHKDLVSNFILQYFEEDAPYKVKQGVLESLTSILAFSDEEKRNCGLNIISSKDKYSDNSQKTNPNNNNNSTSENQSPLTKNNSTLLQSPKSENNNQNST